MMVVSIICVFGFNILSTSKIFKTVLVLFFYYQAQTEYILYNMDIWYLYFQQTELLMRALNKSAAIQESGYLS